MAEQLCPNSDEIRAFLNDQLVPARDEWISRHFDSCSDCSEALTVVSVNEETVSGADLAAVFEAGRSIPADSFVSEASCNRALQRARTIPHSALSTSSEPAEDFGNRPVAVPMQLGPYELQRQIGSGGMGAVYQAKHSKLGRTVAIKILHSRRLERPDAIARFEREMKAVGQLEHPNVVRATDADEDDGIHYLVMEFIDGIDLSQLLRRHGPLSVADACELIRQAAEGLQFVHENGLVHRDIKPANLMLSEGAYDAERRATAAPHSIGKAPDEAQPRGKTPCVKILDLGLALLDELDSDGLTSAGHVMGTVDFMAPEMLDEAHRIDIRADIYSLGATLYKLLTGRVPFDDGKPRSQLQKLRDLATRKPPPVVESRPDLPRDLSATLDRMLASNVDERFSTPGEVADALAGFSEGSDLAGLRQRAIQPASEPDTTAPPSESFTRRPAEISASSRRKLVTSVCVAATVAGALLWGAIELLMKSPEGTVILQFDDPKLIGSVITIDDENVVTIRDAAGAEPLRISADGKERALKVVRNGIPIFTRQIKLRPDEKRSIVVTWEPPEQSPGTVPVAARRPGSRPTTVPPLAIAPFTADEAQDHQKAWARYLSSTVEPVNSLGMRLRLIPPGEFLMGAPNDDPDAGEDDKPQHRVRLTTPFWMCETEVTTQQFAVFMADTDYVTEAEVDGEGAYLIGKQSREPYLVWNRHIENPSFLQYPVRNVSWGDATKFCEWLSKKEGRTYRLPTEAEWEYACRAGTTSRYSFGDDFDSELASAKVTSSVDLRRVAQFPANPFGLYDMHGNADEMCRDVARHYTIGPAVDPVGSLDASLSPVVRGGSVTTWTGSATSSARNRGHSRLSPGKFFATAVKGFRVVMLHEAPPATKLVSFRDSGQRLGADNSISVTTADIDGDGDLDAVVVNFRSPWQVWLNDGQGRFDVDDRTNANVDPLTFVELGDLNGDGMVDAVFPYHKNPVRVGLNDGSGRFIETDQMIGGDHNECVALIDVDADKDLDMFIGRDGPDAVWLNDGTGRFHDSEQSLGETGTLFVVPGDLNGDQALDVVTGTKENFCVWLNDGHGHFRDSGHRLGEAEPGAIALGDLDDDGDLDIFEASADADPESQPNQVWMNQGDGTFLDSGQALGQSISGDVVLCDVDGDRDLDAVVLNFAMPDEIWLNNGKGIFHEGGRFPITDSASAEVSLGDLNGDGQPDLFITNFNAQPNRVWFGIKPGAEAAPR